MEYPEHNRMAAVKDPAQIIGNFLDWLRTEQNVCFGFPHRNLPYLVDHQFESLSIEQILAIFFQIDLKIIEAEKDAMLEEVRAKGNHSYVEGQPLESAIADVPFSSASSKDTVSK